MDIVYQTIIKEPLTLMTNSIAMFEKSSKIQLGHDKQLLVKGGKSGKSNTHSFDTKKI